MSAPKKSIVTFDIWDTCLVRASGKPHTTFAIVARELLPTATEAEVATLAQQRIQAERDARKSAERGECTISEIENTLAQSIGAKAASDFIAAELRTERVSVRPVAATLAAVQKARADGATIAFLSDMYLPTTFLRELLETHGFATPADPVFVSGDRRANKHSGMLYDMSRKELDAADASWTHHGDNPRADIAAAKQKGITAVEVRLADWTPVETRALAAGGIHGERIAAAMRAVRLGADTSVPQERASFLSGVAAPWLVALTTRTLSLAREHGIRRLYFVARDGDMPLRLARILAPAEIECRYLFGSRKAWCFPAMFDLSEASTSWLRLAPTRPDGLLASLGFTEAERNEILSRCGIEGADRGRRHSQEQLAPIWADVRANGLQSTIVERTKVAREACVAYLRSQGLFDDLPWGIADVGWSLHGQAALKRLLSSESAPREPAGFYFMTRRDRRPPAETGPASAWLDESINPDGNLLSWMSPVVEECLLTSADPSVVGYEGAGADAAPVFSGAKAGSETVRHATELRAFSESFAREIAADTHDPEFVSILERVALAELMRFLREPMEEEVTSLLGLRHATAPGASANDTQALVRPYSLGDAVNILLRRAGLRRSGPDHEPYWHSGSMALSPPLARAGMRFALRPNPLHSRDRVSRRADRT